MLQTPILLPFGVLLQDPNLWPEPKRYLIFETFYSIPCDLIMDLFRSLCFVLIVTLSVFSC